MPDGYDYSNCYVSGIRMKLSDNDYYGLTYPLSIGIKNNQIGVHHDISWLANNTIIFYISKIPE